MNRISFQLISLTVSAASALFVSPSLSGQDGDAEVTKLNQQIADLQRQMSELTLEIAKAEAEAANSRSGIIQETEMLAAQKSLEEAQLNLLKTRYNVPQNPTTPRQASFDIKKSDVALTQSHFMAYRALGNSICVEVEDLLRNFEEPCSRIIVDVLGEGSQTIAFGVNIDAFKQSMKNVVDRDFKSKVKLDVEKIRGNLESVMNDKSLKELSARIRREAYGSLDPIKIPPGEEEIAPPGGGIRAQTVPGVGVGTIADFSLAAVGTLNGIASVLDYFKVDQEVQLTGVDVSNKAMEALVVSAMRENLAHKMDVEFYSSREIPLHFSNIPDLITEIGAHKSDLEKLRGSITALKNIVDPTYQILETHVKLLIASDKMVDPTLSEANSDLLAMKKELSDLEKELTNLKKDPANNSQRIIEVELRLSDVREDIGENEKLVLSIDLLYTKLNSYVERFVGVRKIQDNQLLALMETQLATAVAGMTEILSNKANLSDAVREDSIQSLLSRNGLVIKCSVEFSQAETTVQKAPLFLTARVRSAGGIIFWYEAFNSRGEVLASGVAGSQEKQGLFKFVKSRPLWERSQGNR